MRFYSDVMLKIHDLVFQNSFPVEIDQYFIMPEVYLRIFRKEKQATNVCRVQPNLSRNCLQLHRATGGNKSKSPAPVFECLGNDLYNN
jgi:hypothetical protein